MSDKLERLLNLVAALRAAERPLTRDDLRERVPGYPEGEEAARRAFERDKDALRSMGIPISVEPSEKGNPDAPEGYRIPAEQYELPDPGLDADELAALHLAVSAVRVEGGEATAAIWKLGGAPAATTAEAPGAEVALAGSEHLPLLFTAVSERRPVRFAYKGETRTIDPWRLAFRGGRWYLTGRDHRRDEERQFRLDRLTNPEPAGEAGAFERPADAARTPPPPWAMGEEDPVVARILVDPDQAVWAEGFFGGADAVAERRDDGSIVFELTVTNRDAFRSMVLGFLDHAEVLEPKELRDDLVGWLRALAEA